MNYRENKLNGDKLSVLGYGCMRFPKDDKLVEELVLHAVNNGINYFDTAYIYPNNEEALGKAVKKLGVRDKIKIATKLPPYFVKKTEDLDKLFYKQLERLKTTYIDYYFMHMLTDINVWKRLCDLGIIDWINEKKRTGEIKNIGFSYHGGKDEFIKLIDAYDWEFTMIQYNYLDEHKQAGKSGLLYAAAKNMPIFIMEPLRGGKLVSNLPKDVYKIYDGAKVKRSPAEWAFRWLWNQPEVTCVLSGMNDMKMLEENIKTANSSSAGEFTETEHEMFRNVTKILTETIRVPCTGCNYCMPCPQGVDIPTCLSCVNNITIEKRGSAIRKYIMQTAIKSKPQVASLCNKCGKCEKHCPQKIEIRKELEYAAKQLEGFWMKPVVFIIKKFMRL